MVTSSFVKDDKYTNLAFIFSDQYDVETKIGVYHGLDRIFKEYKNNKEQPVVLTSLNMFKVTFPDLNYKFIIDISENQNGTQEITQEITQENIYVLILEIIKINPKVTRREIANKLSLSPDKIKYQLDKMKKAGIIKHEGPTKTGYWKIIRYSIK